MRISFFHFYSYPRAIFNFSEAICGSRGEFSQKKNDDRNASSGANEVSALPRGMNTFIDSTSLNFVLYFQSFARFLHLGEFLKEKSGTCTHTHIYTSEYVRPALSDLKVLADSIERSG